MDLNSIFTLAAALSTVAAVITGSSIYFMRKSTERIESGSKEQIAEIKTIITRNNKETKDDHKALLTHIDEKIDKMDAKMESSSREVKEYISSEVKALRLKNNDQDSKIDHAREKISALSEDQLKLKIEFMEKFERKKL